MNRLDLIIDALSFAQNSVWSKLNEQALAAARELQAEKQEPINKMPTKIFGPNLEEILNAAGFYRQPEQEPVAWGFSSKSGAIMDCISHEQHKILAGEYDVPLYTAPPNKPWVGLTNEELVELRETHETHIFQLMFAIEAKLKEKNDG